MINNNLPPRAHPLLPTFHETRAKPDFLSDHLPILLTVKDEILNKDINILSFNVLNRVSNSGLHPRDMGRSESQEQQKERYNKICEYIKRAINKFNIDALFFQEAYNLDNANELSDILDSNWRVIKTDGGVITCYDTDRFDLTDEQYDARERVHSLFVSDKKSEDKVTVSLNNIWGHFYPVPFDGKETLYKSILNDNSQISILAGDHNLRIAPIDNIARNITTTVVPPLGIAQQVDDYPENMQLTDFPDGGFVKQSNGKIVQLENNVLDLTQCNILNDNTDVENRTHYDGYRIVVCLDDRQVTTKIINDDTYSSYQQYLGTLFNETVYVHPAVDDNNKKAVSISFEKRQGGYSALRELVRLQISDAQVFQLNNERSDNQKTFSCIVVPESKLETLHCLVQDNLIENAINGISKYLSRPRDFFSTHLGFFSRIFDNKRGKYRAMIYQDALADKAATHSDKLLLLYSLLSSNDGITLKEDVAKMILGNSINNVPKALDIVKVVLLRQISDKQEINNKVAKIIKVTNYPPSTLPVNPRSLVSGILKDDKNIMSSMSASLPDR